MKSTVLAIAILNLLGAVVTSAASIPVTNFSFESPVQAPGTFSSSIPGWTQSGVAGVFNPFALSGVVPTDGQQVGFIGNASGPGSQNISQVLAATLVASSLYTLKVDFLARADCCPWPGSELDLMAGGTVLAFATIPTLAPGGVQTSTVTFTASPGNPLLGQALTIRIVDLGSVSSQIDFDNVRLDGPVSTPAPQGVPEPMTIGLAGAGLLLIAATKHKKMWASPE